MPQEVAADKRTVKLPRVRISFTDTLLTPGVANGVEDGRPSYGCNIILEKSHPNFAALDARIREALSEAGRQFNGKENLYKTVAEDNPKRVAYRNGNRFKNTDGVIYDGYEGNFAISAKGPKAGRERPKLLDRRKRDVTRDDKDIPVVFYSGTYADVICSFYATDKGGQGIFCSIDAIRSHEEGERLGGGGITVTDDMFDDLPDDDAFGGDGDTGGGDFGV